VAGRAGHATASELDEGDDDGLESLQRHVSLAALETAQVARRDADTLGEVVLADAGLHPQAADRGPDSI